MNTIIFKIKNFLSSLYNKINFRNLRSSFIYSLFFSLIFSSFFVYILLPKVSSPNYVAPTFSLKNLGITENKKENTESKNSDFLQLPATQETRVVNAVKKDMPSVVSIVITKEVPKYVAIQGNNNPFGNLFGINDPFGMFFNQPQYQQNGTEKKEIGGGTGFVVSKNGLIVTNKHVASDDTAEYTAVFSNGKKYTAKILARDPVYDIAILKIDGNNFTPLSLGNSDTISLGQSVIAIGNALAEFQNSVSVGIISGLSRSITASDQSGANSESLEKVIQTDAAINPGNSGGPLIDLDGNVIGVNVAVVQGAQNIGFALPINIVKSIIDSVNLNGKITRPYIGVRYTPITSDLAQKNNLAYDYGALIKSDANGNLGVVPGSPADKAGLTENDIILEVDGNKVDAKNSLSYLVRSKKPGDNVSLKIYSKGQIKNVNLILGSTSN